MTPAAEDRQGGLAHGRDYPHSSAIAAVSPPWLREFGLRSWLLVGIALVGVAVISLLAMTDAIVMPLITAGILAAILSPVLAWLVRRGLPRGLGAAALLLAMFALVIGLVVLIVGGVLGQDDDLSGHLSKATDKISGWLKDLGVDTGSATSAPDDAGSALSKAVPALLNGVTAGIATLSSLAIFLSFTLLSLFFLLKDGPQIRRWIEPRMGVSEELAHLVVGRVTQSLRGYFVGVTYIALFNAVLVGVGALVIGIPLAGTIAIVTFCGAYIPYLGAWAAGAFAVLVALGTSGTDAAIAMAILQLLANGILQQMVQPIAYGAALGIHPLAVLIVTIAGGAIFGAVGLILSAPLTSAITRISADLRERRNLDPATAPQPPPDAMLQTS